MAAKQTKKQRDDEFKEEVASGIHFTRSKRACGHETPIADYNDMRGRQYKVGPQTHNDTHCPQCDGAFNDQQVEDRMLWKYRLIHSIRFVHGKAILDREMALYQALKLRFAGQEVA